MRIWKKAAVALLGLVLAAAVVTGVAWNLKNFHMVDFRFYPKDAEKLDLRGRSVSVEHYEKIREKLPDCEILWDVPFQGALYHVDTQELTVTELKEKDLEALRYLPELKRIDAGNCTDYGLLAALQAQYPQIRVSYHVDIGGEPFPGDLQEIRLKDLAEEEVAKLAYLPRLKTVVCAGGGTDFVSALQEYCGQNQIDFQIAIGKALLPADAKSVTLKGVTEEELTLLGYLPALKQLHLQEPKASAESLIRLRNDNPQLHMTWELEVCGQICTSDMEEIDLSKAKVTNVSQFRDAMAYFPNAEKLFLGACGIDNETLAACREEVRGQYTLVWTVQLGKKLTARTDDTTFMPVREYVYYFNDEEAYNLRYCEDMVCIDIGHMSIHNIDFVEFMPDLEYLILAHTQLQYIEPIRSCKNLKFLELDWSPIRDYSPLLGCTALEDLNLGNTYADMMVLKDMTWLKNLWIIGCGGGYAYKLGQALPNTKIVASGSATVDNGWRDLPNYYAMRDTLGMYYMSW